MGKHDIEIIPPSHLPAPRNGGGREVSYGLARENPGGIISSALMRWEANRHTRVYGALAARTRAQADYFDAQTQAVESYVKRGRAVHRLGELPEILAADRYRRRAERAEELREIEHQRELDENRRRTEVAHAQAVLVDAQQALEAQRKFGYLNYELAWKKKNCELLGVELDAAERRALLQETRGGKPPSLSEAQLVEQLYAKRDELRADGLDTSRVDAALASVGKR